MGEPARRTAEARPSVAGTGRDRKVPVRLICAFPTDGESASQKVRRRCLLCMQLVEPVGELACPYSQQCPAVSGRVAGLKHNERGPRFPPSPPLLAEEITCGDGPLSRQLRVSGGVGRASGREEQFRGLSGLAAAAQVEPGLLLDPSQGLRRKSGGQQHRTAVERELGHRYGQGGVPSGGLVEKPESCRQVAFLKGNVGAVMHRHRGLKLLTGGREQALGDDEVCPCRTCVPACHVHQKPVVMGAGLPHLVTAPVQQIDRPAKVSKRLLVPT
jgi:hypothetical protein